jgi:hypothetical protein
LTAQNYGNFLWIKSFFGGLLKRFGRFERFLMLERFGRLYRLKIFNPFKRLEVFSSRG